MLEELKEAHQKAWGVIMRLLMLIGPFAAYGLLLVFFWFVYPPQEGFALFSFSPQYLVLLGLLLVYLIPPFGKETVIPVALLGGEALINLIATVTGIVLDPASVTGFPLWVIVIGIVGLDVAVSAFVTLNFNLLLKIPGVGRFLRWIMRGADNIIQSKPWVKNLSSTGLLLFMYIPFQGSGALTSSVIARLLNYPPIFAIGLVTFGSLLSTLSIGLGLSSILALWQVNPVLGILMAAALLGLITLFALSWGKIVNKLQQNKAHE